MPLNPSGLESDLAAIFGPDHRPQTAAEAAQRWAAAYGSYASAAADCAGASPLGIPASQASLQAALAAAFANNRATAADTAQALGAAYSAFWGPIIFVGVPIMGTVILPGIPAALQAALLSAWPALAASRASADDAAQQLAQALHTFTQSVIVIHVFPPPGPPPPCTAPIS